MSSRGLMVVCCLGCLLALIVGLQHYSSFNLACSGPRTLLKTHPASDEISNRHSHCMSAMVLGCLFDALVRVPALQFDIYESCNRKDTALVPDPMYTLFRKKRDNIAVSMNM
ncbi:uncharacterized protein BJ171DRAFT_490030 [Polychytrium aggregatum]|uniref:uncharacterized protein n=1 Tax=Polychytrium aggregatum TaxID=110093 RepID=UPI0022FE9206|nr:uncharacterized protein BJ171DRAFT_490030 [Polychytrium aggregatum]KAI9208782.1 hypothetical protein BJ171DRAFT_490030 [Polychytrium aggregatum]